jgi:outer membrane protein
MTVTLRKASLPALVALSIFGATPSQGETLMDAFVAAYNGNPVLEAERANLRATDENVSQANAGWRPTLQASGSIGRNEGDNFFSGDKEVQKPKQGAVSLTQPVFSSFRTLNQRREADAQVMAGRSRLASVEQNVLLGVVGAYMDVLRDGAVLNLRRNNVQVLTRQLEAAADRFEVGEITRTDVSQSEARLSQAVSRRIASEASLSGSRAAYRRLVGDMPGSLEQPGLLPPLPETEEDAINIALAENPDLAGAKFTEKAAKHSVGTAKGAFGPTISFVAEHSESKNSFVNDGITRGSDTLTLQASIPLYQGGAASSKVRQAKYRQTVRRIEVTQMEREVLEEVRNSWEDMRATRAIIVASKAAVDANTIALEGVRQESEVGSRTVLDVLDAEQELLDTQVELVRAERNSFVAGFRLLASMGRVNPSYLELPGGQYDPEIAYRKAKNSWFGWGTVD